ncbi:MAG TPA: formate/nitrite transporter family protein [Candidatus Binatia bacterium]|nr:formate/nitrite transporter family protein [Candidatus Binatia bacterium]
MRRLPREVVHSFVEHAEEFLAAGPHRQAVLAFAAGSFIAFGAMLSIALSTGVGVPGVARLLLGLGFAAGFTLVVLSGSALFTEVNVLLPELFLSRRRPHRRLVRFWIIVYLGNLTGAIFVGVMLNAADVVGPAEAERLAEVIAEKMRFEAMGAEGWIRALVSGILANWLVGMAAFLATAARTVAGKILGIVPPIVAFVGLGVQHVPANMGYFALGLAHGGMPTTAEAAFLWDLFPATIGNLIGGSVLVALLFWYTFGSSHAEGGAIDPVTEVVGREHQESGERIGAAG